MPNSSQSKIAAFVGLLREFLMAAAALLVAWGHGNGDLWNQVIGGLVALAVLLWGFRSNQGFESLLSVVRKVISAAAGVAVYTGWLSPEKATLLIGAIMAGITFFWTTWSKGLFSDDDGPIPPIFGLLLLVPCLMFLSSCGAVLTYDGEEFDASAVSRYGTLEYRDGHAVITPSVPIAIPVNPAK